MCLFKVLTPRVASRIGQALVDEGCDLPSVQRIAASSRARDFDRLEVRNVPLLRDLPRYQFKIPVAAPHGLGVTERTQEIVLPHELFSYLHGHAPGFFHRIFGTAHLADFWRRQDPSRLSRYPVRARHDPARVVPLQLYGDNVAVCKTVSALVMLFRCSCAFRLPAIASLLPISSTVLKDLDRCSLNELFSVIRWSFGVLASGLFPDRDHRGEEWVREEDAHRSEKANTALADGYVALFWEAVGDWEWLAQSFGLDVWQKYYLCRHICHKCFAATDGPDSYRTLDYGASIWRPDRVRTLEDLLAAVDPPPALVLFDGFNVCDSLLWDWMHCSPLGVQHKAAGACLVEMCVGGRWGRFGGPWRIRTGVALKRAYTAFVEWARANRIEHSQRQFTAASLSVAEGAAEVPHLKGKAHNLMTVTKWLASILQTDVATPRCRQRSRVMWALALLDTVFSAADMWLNDNEVSQVEAATAALFPSWRMLYEESRGEKWPILPKHHAMMHILRDCISSRRNPASYWAFAGEHSMGLCKRSLGNQFQRGIERRMLRAALFRLSVCASEL